MITPLPQVRAAQPFEALQADVAAIAETTGEPPQIFLANIGPLRQHKARADFAQGFFEVGGFEIVYPPGFRDGRTGGGGAVFRCGGSGYLLHR
ncbi:MAG: hypothetical protein R3C44_14310 [Chloroflexota bacterium]